MAYWPAGWIADERALKSRSAWKSICDEADIWYDTSGSVHLAHHADEWTVLQEPGSLWQTPPGKAFIKEETAGICPAATNRRIDGRPHSKGMNWSFPVQHCGIARIPHWKYGIEFFVGKKLISTTPLFMWATTKLMKPMFICSGAMNPVSWRVFETAAHQMQPDDAPGVAQPGNWKMGRRLWGLFTHPLQSMTPAEKR